MIILKKKKNSTREPNIHISLFISVSRTWLVVHLSGIFSVIDTREEKTENVKQENLQ